MRPFATLGLTLLLVMGIVAACRDRTPAPLPTILPDVDVLATQNFRTENAPPPRFRGELAVERIDENLDALSGWHYTVSIAFDGVFAGTSRQTTATTSAEVWYSDLGAQRRVVLSADGEIFGRDEPETLEGVRLGQDTYLVQTSAGQSGICFRTNDSPGAAIADLGAGELIGGVRRAVPSGHRGTINGEAVWRYDFLAEDLVLPNIELTSEGRILFANGELWFAPEHEAVVRYYLTLDVENAVIFDSTLPVTGTVVIRYDLYEVGMRPNISIPFGC